MIFATRANKICNPFVFCLNDADHASISNSGLNVVVFLLESLSAAEMLVLRLYRCEFDSVSGTCAACII